MQIFGAGMAGLLSANMLRRHSPKIYEAQTSLPNNHAALLRFRTDAVSKSTGIPFKKVTVRKAIKHKDEFLSSPRIDACNSYSYKVTGKVMGRSIWNLDPAERYIAPLDFISQASRNLNISYGQGDRLKTIINNGGVDKPVISTIPMPVLMDMVGWKEKPKFNFLPIWSLQLQLGDWVDIYQTIYYSEAFDCCYRASITGSLLIVEMNQDPKEHFISDGSFLQRIRDILYDFGIAHTIQTEKEIPYDGIKFENVKHQQYGKLLPIDESIRKEFILAMTDKYRIYSLGRFATWRQILMDDVVNDVHVIEKFITERDNYKRKLAS